MIGCKYWIETFRFTFPANGESLSKGHMTITRVKFEIFDTRFERQEVKGP